MGTGTFQEDFLSRRSNLNQHWIKICIVAGRYQPKQLRGVCAPFKCVPIGIRARNWTARSKVGITPISSLYKLGLLHEGSNLLARSVAHGLLPNLMLVMLRWFWQRSNRSCAPMNTTFPQSLTSNKTKWTPWIAKSAYISSSPRRNYDRHRKQTHKTIFGRHMAAMEPTHLFWVILLGKIITVNEGKIYLVRNPSSYIYPFYKMTKSPINGKYIFFNHGCQRSLAGSSSRFFLSP